MHLQCNVFVESASLCTLFCSRKFDNYLVPLNCLGIFFLLLEQYLFSEFISSTLWLLQILTVISTIDDLNYPEKTDTYFIVNAPYIFSACWKVRLYAHLWEDILIFPFFTLNLSYQEWKSLILSRLWDLFCKNEQGRKFRCCKVVEKMTCWR